MTQELSKSFNPKEIEEKWYTFWESEGYYKIGSDFNSNRC
jgi:valyl-tRNA synthetase